jgi:hypothetical protein
MGLYEVLDGLAPGKCVEYHGVEGLIVVYEPYFHIVGRLDVAVRTRGIDSAGDVIDRDHGYLGVDRTWCENQEEELRELGIRPDAYTIA